MLTESSVATLLTMSRRTWFLLRLPLSILLGAAAGYGFSYIIGTDPGCLYVISPSTVAILGKIASPWSMTAIGAVIGLGFAGPPPVGMRRGHGELDDELLRAEIRASYEHQDAQ